MSSSNRTSMPCEAAVYRNDQPVGPVRLPMIEKASFVAEFNRLYRSAGIEIEQLESAPAENATGTSEI